MYRYVLCLLLILLLFPTLVACGGAWQAGAKEPSAIPNATPTLAEAEAPEQANSPQATPTPASCPSPTAEPQEATPQTGRGLLYVSVEEGTVWLSGEGKPRAIGSLPGDAAYRTLGRHGLAYVSANQIQVLDLTDGTTRTLYDLGERRPGQDFDLRWLDGVREDDEGNESSRLAYAVAWDEPDGSRLVELGLIQGLDRRAVGTVARPAGPTPTSPSIPPVEPGPGFANLKILGYDIHDRLVVTPVGCQGRYSVL
ncbi:MAG: hypothetical protein DRI48_07590 [Chloroflexi bacterium]|nr:MAG: hypothetical protein DRI48_07590 [Chloroflexota bacterium]